MRFPIATALFVASTLLLPTGAGAQEAPRRSDVDLQLEAKRKRLVVLPPVAVERAIEEAARVEAEEAARTRRERLVRQLQDPRPRWPHLEYPVTSGIQQRNVQNARRR